MKSIVFKLSFSLILSFFLVLASCNLQSQPTQPTTQPPYKSAITPSASPETGSSPKGVEAADDVVTTPGGSQYRGNITHALETVHWPSVKTVQVTMISGTDTTDTISVRYRNNITTNSGETRNNIINVMWSKAHLNSNDSLDLYCTEIPPGLTLTQGRAGGMIGTTAGLLIIKISKDIKPGQYTINIGVIVNDKNYGTLPCNIDVLNTN